MSDGIARPACRAPVDGTAACARVVLGDLRSHAIGATRRDESCRVVMACRTPNRVRPYRWPASLARWPQATPVVRQHVGYIAKYRACVATLVEQLRLTVAARFMRFVAALLAMPTLAPASIAPEAAFLIGRVLAHEALMARLRLNQRVVDAEVPAREMTACMRRVHRLVGQTHDDIVPPPTSLGSC